MTRRRNPASRTLTRGRSAYLPVRKSELVDALTARLDVSPADQTAFRTFCTMLSSLLHHDYFSTLETLRDAYAYFDPSGPQPRSIRGVDVEALYTGMHRAFENVLKQANFDEIPPEELTAYEFDTKTNAVQTRAPKWAYDTVRFFRRGRTRQETEVKSGWLWGKKREMADAYDDVVLFVRFKKEDEKTKNGLVMGRRLPLGAKPGSVMIKYFHNLPVNDIAMLYPDLRVVMTRADALLLGGPALAGAIPILLNIVPAISVVLVLGGALVGVSGSVSQNQMTQALGAFMALIGAGAFVLRQYTNYAFKKLKYQKRIADHIYYKNINNNAGVFESLISAAEEQDAKEAILAYTFLRLYGGVPDKDTLDQQIEDWLRATFETEVDFEIGDALRKLEGLGLVRQEGEALKAVPLADALVILDTAWDALFQYRRGP